MLDGSEELVCHKTNISELNSFLQQDEAYLFKGRMQLNKTGNEVAILMKGEVIGVIPESVLTSFPDQRTLSTILP